ncbi:MAG: hypothetical protein NVS3B10_18180 [Polyangiales bacterium]
MIARPRFPLAALALVGSLGCSSSVLRYPAGDAADFVEGQGGKSGHLAPGEMRFRRSACKDFDLHADYRTLDENALAEFLRGQGFTIRAERARNDLVYFDVTGKGLDEPARLRIAILKSPGDAGKELHEAVLQHGEGSWGVHRANLAILAPIADPAVAVAFASHTKLACWGVFVMAGRDDSFVVPGAYTEL